MLLCLFSRFLFIQDFLFFGCCGRGHNIKVSESLRSPNLKFISICSTMSNIFIIWNAETTSSACLKGQTLKPATQTYKFTLQYFLQEFWTITWCFHGFQVCCFLFGYWFPKCGIGKSNLLCSLCYCPDCIIGP